MEIKKKVLWKRQNPKSGHGYYNNICCNAVEDDGECIEIESRTDPKPRTRARFSRAFSGPE